MNLRAQRLRTAFILVQRLERSARDFDIGQSHRRQRGAGEGAELDIIDSHDRDILGHTQAKTCNRAHRADGGQIVGGQNGCRALPRVEDAQHRLMASVHAMVAFLDQRRMRLKAAARADLTECLIPHDRGAQAHGAADEANPAMAQVNQMFDRELRPRHIVDLDAVNPRTLVLRIQKNQRDGSSAEGLERMIIHLGCQDGDPVHLAL